MTTPEDRLTDFADRVVVVTGGSRGLGRAMVEAFARCGADVVIASRKLDACEALASEVSAATGRRALPVACHVGDWEQCDALTEAVYDTFGRCDVLVNNAGSSPLYPSLAEVSEAPFDKTLAVNLRDPEVTELLAELIARAGNFLTNFPPVGWMRCEGQRSSREELVMLVMTGSNDGTSALDYTINCAVGYPAMTGHPDDPRPVNNVVPAWDLVCGQMAALGLVAADRHRYRTGEGQQVTIALSDVALATVGSLGNLAEAQVNGQVRGRVGNAIYGAFGRDFKTADDRRVMVVAITPKQWRGLLEVTGMEAEVAALAAEPGVDFADEGARYGATGRLCDLFDPWFADRTLADVAPSLIPI